MINAKRDQNDVPVSLGVNSIDSVTPIMLMVDPVTNYLLVESSSDSVTTTHASIVKIDQNDRKTSYGISNVDGTTLVPIRTDSQGRLLVQST